MTNNEAIEAVLFLGDHQTCPRCGGACACEDFSREVLNGKDGSIVVLLNCEFCAMGWEALFENGALEILVVYSAEKDPVKYGMFLQRLRDANCVAA